MWWLRIHARIKVYTCLKGAPGPYSILFLIDKFQDAEIQSPTKDIPISQNQYRDARSQGISNNDVDLVPIS